MEADSAAPRVCLNFSDRLASGRDYGDFVSVEGGTNLAIEGVGQQICIDGVEHGRRYRVTARAGIPAADGETLAKSAVLDIFVRDRAPSVRFLGDAYVLPAGGEPTIPVVTVNTNRVNASALPDRRPPARRRHRRRHLPLPALVLGGRRDRIEVRREGLDGHGRRAERRQPRDDDRDPGRRAATGAEARRLCADGGSRERLVRRLGAEGDAVVRRHRPRADHALRQRRAPRDGALARLRRPGRRRRAEARRRQQRGARRGDHGRGRLCKLRPRPDPRHGIDGAGAPDRADGGRRLQLPRPLQGGDGFDRPRRRRPRAAEAARRVPDDGARHLSRRRDRLRHGAHPRRDGARGGERAADRDRHAAGRQGKSAHHAHRRGARRQRHPDQPLRPTPCAAPGGSASTPT